MSKFEKITTTCASCGRVGNKIRKEYFRPITRCASYDLISLNNSSAKKTTLDIKIGIFLLL